MIREAPAGRDPAERIARRAMEETARNKKVLPTHLVAETLMSRERLTKRELHPAAAEELERLIAFHRQRYGSAPDLDDSFSRRHREGRGGGAFTDDGAPYRQEGPDAPPALLYLEPGPRAGSTQTSSTTGSIPSGRATT